MQSISPIRLRQHVFHAIGARLRPQECGGTLLTLGKGTHLRQDVCAGWDPQVRDMGSSRTQFLSDQFTPCMVADSNLVA